MKMMLPDVIGHENQSQHYQHHRCLCLGAVHKVRHAIFGQFLPSSPCHTSSHIPGTPESTSPISDPPFLEGLVQKTRTKAPSYKFRVPYILRFYVLPCK